MSLNVYVRASDLHKILVMFRNEKKKSLLGTVFILVYNDNYHHRTGELKYGKRVYIRSVRFSSVLIHIDMFIVAGHHGRGLIRRIYMRQSRLEFE